MKKRIITFISWVILLTPLLASAEAVTITNPLGETDPRVIIATVIKGAFSIAGSVALLMFIYGGILWLTSAGKSEQVTKGKNVIIWTIFGIVLIASSYVIVNAIFNAILTGSV